MSHVENTNYLGKDDADQLGDMGAINQSSRLDDLASKLRPSVLQDASFVFIPKETKTKSRMVDLLSAIAAGYKLMVHAVTSPVFLVQHHYDWERAEGYYFFIGTQQEIERKLLELSQDRDNLVENSRWH
jgi:hypothetical protein